jgi:hypothetical protein
MRRDITIRQGATFYEEFHVFPTARLSIAQIRAMSIHATILDTNISFACSWLSPVVGETSVTGVWSLSRDTTVTLELKSYNHNLDISDGSNTYPLAEGLITVTKGQPPL